MKLLSECKILNLGAGGSDIEGAINMDSEESTKPDVVGSLKEKLPFDDDRFNKVLLFHCIEHIERKYHNFLLSEIWRVLEPEGVFLCAFPEFGKVAQYWINDTYGKRDVWERILYGRQLYPGDYHVCAMDSLDFRQALFENGFKVESLAYEPREDYNVVIKAVKIEKPKTYEQVVYEDVFG